MKYFFVVSTVFLLCFAPLSAAKLAKPGEKRNCTPVFPVAVAEYNSGTWVLMDRDGDGNVDYAYKAVVSRDSRNMRNQGKESMIVEALDFNKDGLMDDFLIYENGILARREVDSNYDGKIDLWAYMEQGMYLVGYEKDEDFDGVIDKVKAYGMN